jgi:hypothetical protein
MSFGGLAAKLATVRRHKHEKPCERCGLYYDHKRYEECPHCAELSDSELEELKARRAAELRGNRKLGWGFFVASLIVLLIILIIAGS